MDAFSPYTSRPLSHIFSQSFNALISMNPSSATVSHPEADYTNAYDFPNNANDIEMYSEPTHSQYRVSNYVGMHLHTDVDSVEADSLPSSASSSGSTSSWAMPLTPSSSNQSGEEWSQNGWVEEEQSYSDPSAYYQLSEHPEWSGVYASPSECIPPEATIHSYETSNFSCQCKGCAPPYFNQYGNDAENIASPLSTSPAAPNLTSPTPCIHQPRPVRPIPIISLSDLSNSSTTNFSMSSSLRTVSSTAAAPPAVETQNLSPLSLLCQPIPEAVLSHYQTPHSTSNLTMEESVTPYLPETAPWLCPCGCTDNISYSTYTAF